MSAYRDTGNDALNDRGSQAVHACFSLRPYAEAAVRAGAPVEEVVGLAAKAACAAAEDGLPAPDYPASLEDRVREFVFYELDNGVSAAEAVGFVVGEVSSAACHESIRVRLS